MKIVKCFFFLFLAVLFSACSLFPDPKSTKLLEQAYPVETAEQKSSSTAYPGDGSLFFLTNTQPAQDAALGALKVVILNQGIPLKYGNFFLADILKSSSGEEIAVSLDRQVAPNALSSDIGLVEFHNIKPGKYGLVFYDGFNIYLLLSPKDGKGILVEIQKGETLDLGTLDFNDLPVD